MAQDEAVQSIFKDLLCKWADAVFPTEPGPRASLPTGSGMQPSALGWLRLSVHWLIRRNKGADAVRSASTVGKPWLKPRADEPLGVGQRVRVLRCKHAGGLWRRGRDRARGRGVGRLQLLPGPLLSTKGQTVRPLSNEPRSGGVQLRADVPFSHKDHRICTSLVKNSQYLKNRICYKEYPVPETPLPRAEVPQLLSVKQYLVRFPQSDDGGHPQIQVNVHPPILIHVSTKTTLFCLLLFPEIFGRRRKRRWP